MTVTDLEAWENGFAAAMKVAVEEIEEAHRRRYQAERWLKSAQRQLLVAEIALAVASLGLLLVFGVLFIR